MEHFYLEDCRQAVLQIASEAGVTISYSMKKQRKIRDIPKPQKVNLHWALIKYLQEKSCRTSDIAVEYYLDDQQTATHWYKGTVISYSRKGYVITFDGCGPEDNEIFRSLKQGVDKGELRLI